MEGAENVQAQTQSMGETGGGLSSEPQSSGSGVSTGEPVAAEPTAAEPVAESQEVSSGATEAVQESFPSVDSFNWQEWDGEDYSLFPETVQPWVNKLSERYTDNMQKASANTSSEIDYWKRMYEAVQYGDEDPRVGDLTAELERFKQEHNDLQETYKKLEQVLEQEREAENDRYFQWFDENYQGKLEAVAEMYGPEGGQEKVLSLMDMDLDLHVAVELALLGNDAVTAAQSLQNKVTDPNIILEVIKSRFPNSPKQAAKPAQPVQEERKQNPATQVVAGSSPVSRPATLSKENAKPVYGSNKRMDALLAAADRAIKQSKRR